MNICNPVRTDQEIVIKESENTNHLILKTDP